MRDYWRQGHSAAQEKYMQGGCYDSSVWPSRNVPTIYGRERWLLGYKEFWTDPEHQINTENNEHWDRYHKLGYDDANWHSSIKAARDVKLYAIRTNDPVAARAWSTGYLKFWAEQDARDEAENEAALMHEVESEDFTHGHRHAALIIEWGRDFFDYHRPLYMTTDTQRIDWLEGYCAAWRYNVAVKRANQTPT
jgi:hypothetical protein